MPNHMHLLLQINTDIDGRPMTAPTISTVINQTKGIISKKAGFSVLQKGFYDHVIRNDNDYRDIWNYIEWNPGKWTEDKLYIPPGKYILRKARSVAFSLSNLTPTNKKEPIPFGIGSFLELLARFELATSSLPIIYSLLQPVIPCYRMIQKTYCSAIDFRFYLSYLDTACKTRKYAPVRCPLRFCCGVKKRRANTLLSYAACPIIMPRAIRARKRRHRLPVMLSIALLTAFMLWSPFCWRTGWGTHKRTPHLHSTSSEGYPIPPGSSLPCDHNSYNDPLSSRYSDSLPLRLAEVIGDDKKLSEPFIIKNAHAQNDCLFDCFSHFSIQILFLQYWYISKFYVFLDFLALRWYTEGGRGKAPGSPYGVR